VRIRGFYAVLDRADEQLARALASHASVVQVRVKPADASDIAAIARLARRICEEHGTALVVNDRVDIALAVGADGVHLGQADLPVAAARAVAGARLAIGVSTHSLAQVERAVADGADYLGFGPIFSTATKANPDPIVGLDGLRAAVATAGDVPIVAIGGLRPEHARSIYAAGAAAICAISAVNDAADPSAVAGRFAP
jgi:thiamine-phosphate pyrophosphorylase